MRVMATRGQEMPLFQAIPPTLPLPAATLVTQIASAPRLTYLIAVEHAGMA